MKQSLFGEQLENRTKNDQRISEANLRKLGDSVTGRERVSYGEETLSEGNLREIARILQFQGLPMPEKPLESCDLEEQLDYCLQPSGGLKRLVELNDVWWKNGDGPMLAVRKESGKAVALLPNAFRGYHYIDPESGKKVRITRENQDQFELEAWCFYKPLPNQPLSSKDFIRFLLKQLNRSDILILVLSVIFITLFGTLTPFATRYALGNVVPSGVQDLLIPLGILLLSAAIGSWMMNVVKSSVMARIDTRLDVVCENAIYSRVIRLPASFFGDKTAGGLAQSIIVLNMVPAVLTSILFGTFLEVLVSIIYIIQIVTISAPLALPVFVIYVVEILIFAVTVRQERSLLEKKLSGQEKNSALVFALLSGITKIKVSGSEERAFAKWMGTYSEATKYSYKILFPATMRVPLMTAVHLLGLLWIYVIAYQSGVSVAQFAAFSTAFGMTMAGITALSASGSSFSMLGPVLKMGEPILQAVPEQSVGKRVVSSLSGKIELNQVVFRYSEDAPAILNGIDLKIEPGEYIAVVGRSGCGKSTLMRILLGFEEPEQGTVYYDDYDIESIDKQSLRRRIGTVLQNGKLFTGDIYSNITITAPWMSEDDAWEAAEKAGMAEDIRRMPMQMHTMITEGGGGISGGQKQRLLIARAICPKPSILMFDEATSALDNLTQKIVTDSLDEMNCTRIVIAHRLSTIRDCDRIIVLDHGKIAEDGTYEELLAKGGIFTELVNRQLMEEE